MGFLIADTCLLFAGLGMIDQPTAEIELGLGALEGASITRSPKIAEIARNFQLEDPIEVAHFDYRGNINFHTYHITSGGKEYLLQKVNTEVFTMPHGSWMPCSPPLTPSGI